MLHQDNACHPAQFVNFFTKQVEADELLKVIGVIDVAYASRLDSLEQIVHDLFVGDFPLTPFTPSGVRDSDLQLGHGQHPTEWA